MLNPPVNGKIQRLFKAFECFSSTFQGKFNFQGLLKTVLYIQVLFKSANPGLLLKERADLGLSSLVMPMSEYYGKYGIRSLSKCLPE